MTNARVIPGEVSQPRIAVVSPLFPLRDEPYRGKPMYLTVLELQKLAHVEVFCPIATYPERLKPVSYDYIKPDPSYVPPGIGSVQYFSYPVLPVVSRPFNGYVSYRKMLPRLRRFRPDVVLAYWLYPEGYGAVLAARSLGVPAVVCARGSDLRAISTRAVRRLTEKCVRQASFVLTVSEELRQQAIAFGAPPGRVRTVLNGCDRSVFHPGNREEARRRLGLPEDARLIVYVGHLIPAKGMRELIAAFTGLAAADPALHLACAGEGPLRDELAAAAAGAGLAGRLHLPGACTGPQVAEWLAAANVFCLPSYSEGCPNVVIEALSCDRPVVATNVGGTPELVSPACGALVPPREVEPLRAALAATLARDWPPGSVSTHFERGWDHVAAETLETCMRVLPNPLIR